jgi:hypothetical protein
MTRDFYLSSWSDQLGAKWKNRPEKREVTGSTPVPTTGSPIAGGPWWTWLPAPGRQRCDWGGDRAREQAERRDRLGSWSNAAC